MNEPANHNSHGAAWVTGIIGLVVCYILSPAPVMWLCEKAGFTQLEWLTWLYRPLETAYMHSEHVKKFYDACFSQFGVN